MPTPGIGDPYWYEWYVGLKYIVEMINPDSGIDCVVFQHSLYDTIDDVVVEYKTGKKQMCYQIKHEIATSAQHNLTFGKLIEENSNKKCLLAEIFLGWKKAVASTSETIVPVLFTNRQLGTRKSNRTFNGKAYQAYPIENFLLLLNGKMAKSTDYTGVSWGDINLANQWNEMCTAIGATNTEEVVPFIKNLSIQGRQPSLANLEQSLISTLATIFACSEGLARELFSQLVFGLRLWTTSRRDSERVTIEDVYSALSAKEDINASQHRLAPPYPFFESRKIFCKELEQQILNTDKKIVFISGDPGSGKTSTISYLQSTTNIFLLRYHTFRPISPEQHFYDLDAGMCSSENLWGTLLIQLRQKFKGKLSQYNVPVNNKLLKVEMMRNHVCRLLGILAEDAVAQNKRIYVCIDGIDHAARANSVVSFLSSLFLPTEIPDGVCFVIVGQPTSIYQAQYPIWLSSNEDIEHIDMPKLRINDIIQLINYKAPQFNTVVDGLANAIYQFTEGNNLSTVFAIEEIKEIPTVDDALTRLSTSGITSDVQQYYTHIWEHMKKEILRMGLQGIFPESIVACPVLLLNGRVNTRILSRALPYALNENDWKLILNKLYPLISPCDEDGGYILFHNDFRVFLMGVISNYRARYEEIALALAKDLLQNDEGPLTYVTGIPLLQCANRTDLIPQYFTPTFVINALAEGISKQRLDDYAHLSYDASCSNRDMRGYINTYLSVKTLHQHIRFYEYYGREYFSNDYPEIASIDISEIRILPITLENLPEYEKVLSLCKKLYKSGMQEYISRSLALYNKWYDSISPYSFIPLCEIGISKDKTWHIDTDEVGIFLKYWGKTAAELNIQLPIIDVPRSELQHRVLTTFGEAYFETCVDQGMMDCVITAINGHYVPQYCFEEKLESIFFSGYTDKVEQYLSKIPINPNNPNTGLLAMAMLVTRQYDANFDSAKLTPSAPINHIYEETCFSIILRSFLLGHCERIMDDAVICGHVNIYYSDLEEKQSTMNQISQLSKFACLLGKYYWDPTAKSSTAFAKFTGWFLTTQFQRRHDYSKARRFLLVALLQSPAGEALWDSEAFLVDLKTCLFQVDNLGMYYKTCILDYLQRHNQLDIIKEYILALYGNDCGRISAVENKVEMHKKFGPYGLLVESEMMKKFTARMKWDVVGYVGHKEYAMQGPSEYFEYISASDSLLWRESGIQLYRQSKIAEISGNRYAYDIRNSVMKAAVQSGLDNFWELHYLDDEFHMNPDLIYHALFEFAKTARNISELEAVWIISCGIHSWYRQEDRLGAKSVFYACTEKASEFNTDFREIVFALTPQWMTIVDHESEKTDCNTDADGYVKQKATEIKVIEEDYNSSTAEDLLSHLPNIPILSHSEERYRIVINRLIALDHLSVENAKLVSDSVCLYLKGHEWSYAKLDEILPILSPILGENIFWSLARTIESNLSDYDYQTSSRNMQVLLKNYFSNNIEQMKTLFEQELTTQELWTSGNGHIPVNYRFDSPKQYFNTPKTVEEMAFYILLEQIDSQNARKIESAIFALHILGKRFNSLMDVIASEWPIFSDIQKDCVLIVVTCWVYDGINLGKLRDTLFTEYDSCNFLSRKYYLHSIFLLMSEKEVHKDIICFSAETPKYSLPQYGHAGKSGGYENFLSLIEEYDDLSGIADKIRKYVSQFSATEVYVNDEYIETGDVRIPTFNPDVNRILYSHEKQGSWEHIPLLRKKLRLLPPEDPFIISEMPQIIYDEQWFPEVSDSSYKVHPQQELNVDQFPIIARKNIFRGKILLAAYICYPWGHEDGLMYWETSKVCSMVDFAYDNEMDWCLGNYGLLTREGSMEETRITSIHHGGISLFNRIGGIKRVRFGDSQIAPSAAWKEMFCCIPSSLTPHIWVDEYGNEVLRLQYFASPIREARRETYTRQPVLFRWVGNQDWLQSRLEKLGLRLRYVSSTETILQ